MRQEQEVSRDTTTFSCASDCVKVCAGKRHPRAKVIETEEGELRNTLFEDAAPETLLKDRVAFSGYRYEKGARLDPQFGWDGRTEVRLQCRYSLGERARQLGEIQQQGRVPPEALRFERIIEH